MLELDQITSLIIEPTAYCNLHCPQCPRFDAEGFLTANLTPAHLNADQLAKNLNLDQLPQLKEVKLEGDYGDIMMHPFPTKFISMFPNQEITAVTNGSMRSTRFWADLADYQNLTVTFSIDGLADTNHIYRINSNWGSIIDNATAYIDRGGRAVWKYIVFRHNEHQVEEVKELGKTMGFFNVLIRKTGRFFNHNTLEELESAFSKSFDDNENIDPTFKNFTNRVLSLYSLRSVSVRSWNLPKRHRS